MVKQKASSEKLTYNRSHTYKPSKFSLKLKSEFDSVKKNGKKFIGNFFILLVEYDSGTDFKYGIICGRKFCTKAVVRNRARRLLKESIRLSYGHIKPAHLLFIPRYKIKNQRFQEVNSEVNLLLERAKLWT